MTMTTLFASFDLPEQLNKALVNMKYAEATPIQAQAIPFALQGRDILGSAQTGTGKTAAFSIPMIVRLMQDPDAMALVLAPTRELAAQTLDVVHKLTFNNRNIRTALLIGGEPMGKQFAQLREGPRVVIGTPGRINDHLRRNPNLLKKVVYVALDEADRMLDMGFSEQIDEVFATIPKERQMVMFSATFPDSIIKFSRSYLNNPERVSVNPEKLAAPKIQHEIKRTTDSNKYTDLLAELEARDGSVIIFVKTQHGTDRLAKRLEHDGYEAVAIHGGLRQNQRDRAVSAFRSKRFRVLVATDVAARGLDIPHIEHVINYDLPQVAEDYIHRIGRTGRAGAEGKAMAFVLPSDTGKWNAINRILNPGEAPMRKERGESGRPNRGFGGKSGGFKSGGYKGQGGYGNKFADRPQQGFKKPAARKDGFRQDGFKQDGFKQDGFKRDGFKKNDFRDAPREARHEPRHENRHENRGDRPDFAEKRSFDKPRQPTDRHWNSKEGRTPYNPAGRKPDGFRNDSKGGFKKAGPGHFSDRASNADRPQGGDRGRSFDRPQGGDRGKAPFNKGSSFKGSSFKGDRNEAGRSFEGKREWNRDDRAPRGGYTDRKPDGFKKAEGRDAPRGQMTLKSKPKAKAPAAKKPFKFKEHSRKERAAS